MCEANLERSLIGHFSPLEDQRCSIKRRHVLIEMTVIAIAAVMCGADGWVAVAQSGRSKESKTLRRSHDRAAGLAALHLVSACAAANRVVLGQVATEAKSNEITAIPQLLALLRIKGCIVTIDAMGCQTKITEQIIEQEGDYVLNTMF